jgi:excisionase family DNA binding protein
MSDLMRTAEVADYLRVSTKTVYRWVDSGRLTAVKVGRGLRFRKVDVEASVGLADAEETP